MQLVNESGQQVEYTITDGTSVDCGTIDIDGLVDLPYYDNKSNVTVDFGPTAAPDDVFIINVGTTTTGQQVEMALIAE